jgi:hypothetical protein
VPGQRYRPNVTFRVLPLASRPRWDSTCRQIWKCDSSRIVANAIKPLTAQPQYIRHRVHPCRDPPQACLPRIARDMTQPPQRMLREGNPGAGGRFRLIVVHLLRAISGRAKAGEAQESSRHGAISTAQFVMQFAPGEGQVGPCLTDVAHRPLPACCS